MAIANEMPIWPVERFFNLRCHFHLLSLRFVLLIHVSRILFVEIWLVDASARRKSKLEKIGFAFLSPSPFILHLFPLSISTSLFYRKNFSFRDWFRMCNRDIANENAFNTCLKHCQCLYEIVNSIFTYKWCMVDWL